MAQIEEIESNFTTLAGVADRGSYGYSFAIEDKGSLVEGATVTTATYSFTVSRIIESSAEGGYFVILLTEN